jgi:excinuclease UvrABC nuclease subunit
MTTIIVSGYARMWPREVFGVFPAAKNAVSKRKKTMAKNLDFLTKGGVYILYRNDLPYYIGQAKKLQSRLRGHAVRAEAATSISGISSRLSLCPIRNTGTNWKVFS